MSQTPQPRVSPSDVLRSQRSTCSRCGIQLTAAALRIEGLCSICLQRAKALLRMPAAGQKVPASNGKLQKSAPAEGVTKARKLATARAPVDTASLGQSALPPSVLATAVINEVRDADKRLSTLLAFVPFAGPLLIGRSESHTGAEKLRFLVLSIAITCVAVIGIALWAQSAANEQSGLRSRMDRDMLALGQVAERYRALRGAYPSGETWRGYAEGKDPRFFDPWNRPYRYEAAEKIGVTIRSLGRDGMPGGVRENSDVVARFPPTDPAP